MIHDMSIRPLYSGLDFDRAHRLRHSADPARLAEHPLARVSLYWRGRQLIKGTPPEAALVPAAALRDLMAGQDSATLLLGMAGEAPVLAADISGLEADEDGPATPFGHWAPLRSVGALLPAGDAALLAYARGMLVWRGRTRFCSVCGSALDPADAGHSAKCRSEACGTLHFPRTDPAIIMLVTDPSGRALLGRQAAWPPGMYSCLAGFVEPGESLEEAVAREVWEEASIRVRTARYFASQPWPFPSSLMIGFMAEADADPPVPDTAEIEDARWVTRAEAARFGEADAPGEGGMFLPRRDSIARLLVEAWLRD